jgi:uncharacterized membrane protein
MVQDPNQSSFGLQPNVAAGLASFFHWLGGLVILLGNPPQPWVRFVAVQSIVLSVAAGIAYFALWVVSFMFLFIPKIGGLFAFLIGIVMLLLFFAYVVAWIVQTVKAFQGQVQRFPVISEWTDRWVPTSTQVP